MLLKRIALADKHSAQAFARRFASGHGHGHEEHDDPDIQRQPDMYRPGSDSFAYDNPWPKLNKGRLDWLFQDGWRRPLAVDQGQKMRRQWLWFNQYPNDEYQDWLRFHMVMPIFFTGMGVWFTFMVLYLRSDWPDAREWALREAHFEIVRRENAGLPFISPDLVPRERVESCLPSEEELRDFEILI